MILSSIFQSSPLTWGQRREQLAALIIAHHVNESYREDGPDAAAELRRELVEYWQTISTKEGRRP